MGDHGDNQARPASSPTVWILRGVVIIALAIDAVVHLRLASDYQLGQAAGIGTGNMFRIAGAAAVLAAVYLLVRGSRAAFAVAFVVAGGALFAVLLYRYVDVPQIGPIPSMYEPVWFFEKTLSAVAEAVGTVAAALGFVLTGKGRRRE